MEKFNINKDENPKDISNTNKIDIKSMETSYKNKMDMIKKMEEGEENDLIKGKDSTQTTETSERPSEVPPEVAPIAGVADAPTSSHIDFNEDYEINGKIAGPGNLSSISHIDFNEDYEI